MGPLSAKQHREYLKFASQEARETAKMEREEARKQQLHEIKLVEAAGKAGQTLGHKEEVHKYKMGTLGAPLKPKTPNPLAGAEIFKRGQHMLPYQVEDAAKARKKNTDTVPAMLTPGEAVIPKPAAQNPKNKPIIKRMVQEGRKANRRGYAEGTVNVNVDTTNLENTAKELANKYLGEGSGYRDGSINIVNSDVIPSRVQQAAGYRDGSPAIPQLMNYNEGTIQVPVPSLAYEHSDVPGSSFEDGTERVYDFKRGSSASYHYEDGIEEVPLPMDMPRVMEQALPSPTVEQPPMPVVAVAPTQDVVFALPAEQVQPQSKTIASPLKTKNELYSDAWARSNEADPKAGTASKNPNSSAYGLYQMTDAAWKDAYKINPSLKGKDISKAETQQEARDAYKQFISNQLKAYRIEPTEEAIAKAWVVGPNGYRQILNGDPNAPLSLSASAIANNPNLQGKTNKQFLEDPNPYSRAPKTDIAVAKPPLSPRDIAIAKQDMATSTNPRVREKAKSILEQAQVPPPTRASTFQESAPDRLVVPYQDPRLLTNEKPMMGTSNTEPPKPIVVDPNADVRENLSTRIDVDEAGIPLQRTTQTVAQANPPVAIPESMKDLEGPVTIEPEERNKIVSLFDEDKDKAIANIAKENELEIDRLRNKITSEEKDPEKQKSMLAKAIEFIYGGPDSMFNAKDLARFAVVAAGGLLTGGSVNGSLRYASRDTLQSSDARHAAQAAQASKIDSEDRAYKRQVELKNIELGVTNVRERQKETKAYFNKTIDDYEKEGRLTPANATLLRKAVYSGNYSIVEKALDDPGTYGTDLFQAGVSQDAKPVTIVEEGYTTGRPAFKDKSGNFVVFDTDAKGNKVHRVISGKNQREVGDTTNVATQNENRFKDNLLASQYFRQDKQTGKTPFDLSSQEVISQLNVWQQEQRRLGLPDDYSRFSAQINNGLDRALKSGERKPDITKMLYLATINTTVLNDEAKMTVNNNQLDSKINGKSIPTSKIGKMVEDIREFNSPKEKYKNKVDEYKAQSTASDKFLENVSTEYEQIKKEEGFTPNALAEKARSKKVDDKLINKIREAPNSYWALMYYRMAIPRKD